MIPKINIIVFIMFLIIATGATFKHVVFDSDNERLLFGDYFLNDTIFYSKFTVEGQKCNKSDEVCKFQLKIMETDARAEISENFLSSKSNNRVDNYDDFQNVINYQWFEEKSNLEFLLMIFKFATERYDTYHHARFFSYSKNLDWNVEVIMKRRFGTNYEDLDDIDSSILTEKVSGIKFFKEQYGPITGNAIEHALIEITMEKQSSSKIYFEFLGDNPNKVKITVLEHGSDPLKRVGVFEYSNQEYYYTETYYGLEFTPEKTLIFSKLLELVLKWDIEYGTMFGNCMDFIYFVLEQLQKKRYLPETIPNSIPHKMGTNYWWWDPWYGQFWNGFISGFSGSSSSSSNTNSSCSNSNSSYQN